MKLNLPKFETVSGNEEGVNLSDIKKIYKDYFMNRDISLKERMRNAVAWNIHLSATYFMFGFMYIAYLTNAEVKAWLIANVPNLDFLFQLIGAFCIFIVGLSYIKDIRRGKQLTRVIDRYENIAEGEDRL